MNIDDLFHSPQDNIARLAEMQVHLYRNDANLQDYFHLFDTDVFSRPRDSVTPRTSINRYKSWSFRAVDKATQIVKRRRIKTDILFSPTPYFGRQTEIRFLARTLLGLAKTGAEILCLLPQYSSIHRQMELELEAAGCGKQVTFLDPEIPFNSIDERMRPIAAQLRGRAVFAKAVEILAPYGLSPTRWSAPDFERTAGYVEAWERLAPSIEFDTVVARCHWYDLCSSVCRTGIERGKPVITFQQGVVDHTLDVPITASKFVAFGAPSASVLAETNRRFFDAVGSRGPRVDYYNAGSLFDVVVPLPDQFSVRSLLFVDFHSAPGDPWGTGKEVEALLLLAEKVLSAKVPLTRLIIRPHPHWHSHDLGACLQLVREHRDVCELSHPVWPLEDDLRRASVVVGIASGVLTIASASGLPTIFMRTEQGFKIRDLECFSPAQTLLPDDAFCEVSRLLTDSESYAEARKVAMHNASEYYANGANAVLDGAFFTSLLNNQPIKKAIEDGPR
ncbi:MAG: hypothetical protein WA354_12125 [Terracidiphilus sp.]